MPVVIAQVDLSQTTTVPTQDDFNALTARVATLEAKVASIMGSPVAPSAESPEGTKATPGSGSIVDSHGATWTVGSNQIILENGISPFNNWQTHELVYHNHTVYMHGLDNAWYFWNGSSYTKSQSAAAPPGA